MSHVVKGKLIIQDMQACEMAAKALGLTLVKGAKTYAWFGRSVGDYPLPEGMTAAELGHCEHKLVLPGCEYEVGLIKRKNGPGYEAIFDFFGPGQELEAKLGRGCEKFRQEYTASLAMLHYQAEGYEVTREVDAKSGQVVVTARR